MVQFKNAYLPDGAEAESQPNTGQAFRDLMQWIGDNRESYSREELQAMLDKAAATLHPDHPDFRAATEERLLEIAKLLRKARLMQESSATAAALFIRAAETARTL